MNSDIILDIPFDDGSLLWAIYVNHLGERVILDTPESCHEMFVSEYRRRQESEQVPRRAGSPPFEMINVVLNLQDFNSISYRVNILGEITSPIPRYTNGYLYPGHNDVVMSREMFNLMFPHL